MEIEKLAAALLGKEREIVDDYVKAFICHQIIQGDSEKESFENYKIAIKEIFENYRLVMQHDINDGKTYIKYWMELNI